MSQTTQSDSENRIALFIDFDNLALGMKQSPDAKFNVGLILDRILEKGRILVKKAYADWSRYKTYKEEFHESAIELIEIPKKRIGGKNSADIRMVVDAMEVAFSNPYVNIFVLVTGDSDFSPLVSKLRENNKQLVGLGMKGSSSKLLVENCDEFIYYEDLVREQRQERQTKKKVDVPQKKQEAFTYIIDAVRGLARENRETIWASMVKQTIKRKRPSFDESYHGYRTFSEMLFDAEEEGILELEKDKKSGSHIVVSLEGRAL